MQLSDTGSGLAMSDTFSMLETWSLNPLEHGKLLVTSWQSKQLQDYGTALGLTHLRSSLPQQFTPIDAGNGTLRLRSYRGQYLEDVDGIARLYPGMRLWKTGKECLQKGHHWKEAQSRVSCQLACVAEGKKYAVSAPDLKCMCINGCQLKGVKSEAKGWHIYEKEPVGDSGLWRIRKLKIGNKTSAADTLTAPLSKDAEDANQAYTSANQTHTMYVTLRQRAYVLLPKATRRELLELRASLEALLQPRNEGWHEREVKVRTVKRLQPARPSLTPFLPHPHPPPAPCPPLQPPPPPLWHLEVRRLRQRLAALMPAPDQLEELKRLATHMTVLAHGMDVRDSVRDSVRGSMDIAALPAHPADSYADARRERDLELSSLKRLIFLPVPGQPLDSCSGSACPRWAPWAHTRTSSGLFYWEPYAPPSQCDAGVGEPPTIVRPLPTLQLRDDLGRLLEAEGATSGVEVGVQKGDFSHMLLTHWPGCQSYGMVDLWRQQADYKDGANVDSAQQLTLMKQAIEQASTFRHVRLSVCRNFSTVCASRLANSSVDFIYLDARHDSLGVLADLNAFWPKLRRGGIMAGHDYIVATEHGNWQGDYGGTRRDGDDYALNADGSHDPFRRAVKGAVDEFFTHCVPRQLTVTYRDGNQRSKGYNPVYNTWMGTSPRLVLAPREYGLHAALLPLACPRAAAPLRTHCCSFLR